MPRLALNAAAAPTRWRSAAGAVPDAERPNRTDDAAGPEMVRSGDGAATAERVTPQAPEMVRSGDDAAAAERVTPQAPEMVRSGDGAATAERVMPQVPEMVRSGDGAATAERVMPQVPKFGFRHDTVRLPESNI